MSRNRNEEHLEKPKRDSELFCVPCSRDGTKLYAFGYCLDCEEHLCKTCFRYHTRPTPLKHHVLVDSRDMPKNQNHKNKKEDDIEKCALHKIEDIKYFCQNHEDVLCSVCVTLMHRECEIHYIPDFVKDTQERFALDILLKNIENFKKMCVSDIHSVKEHIEKTEAKRSETLQEIKRSRKEINNYLDEIERLLIKKVEHVSADEVKNMQTMLSSLEEIYSEICSAGIHLEELQSAKQISKLFVLRIKTEKLLAMLKLKNELSLKVTRKNISFIKTKPQNTNIGELLLEPADLDARISGDSLPLNEWIRGVTVISPQEVIAITSERIVRINVKENKVASEITFGTDENGCDADPFDAVCLPNNKLAVSFVEEGAIRVLSLESRDLTEERCLKMDFQCFGISYCQSKLVVASCLYTRDIWANGELYILDMNGCVLNCISGDSIFKIPEYVEVSMDHKSLIISDAKAHSVKKLDWEGNVLNTFEMDGYEGPQGIQELPDGSILVCYKNANKIVRLTRDLKLCGVVVVENSISNPTALGYCEDTQELFVACDLSTEKYGCSSDGIKKLLLKWDDRKPTN